MLIQPTCMSWCGLLPCCGRDRRRFGQDLLHRRELCRYHIQHADPDPGVRRQEDEIREGCIASGRFRRAIRGAGVVFGRNVLQAREPERFLDALKEVVKTHADPEKVAAKFGWNEACGGHPVTLTNGAGMQNG